MRKTLAAALLGWSVLCCGGASAAEVTVFCTQALRTSLLDLAPRPDENCDRVQAIAAQHLSNVRAKLDDLRKMESALAALVARCDKSPDGCCPVVESLAGAI